MKARWRGGFALGLVVGLLIGLALALGVALYITKAPVPFVNKVPQRTAEQDAGRGRAQQELGPERPAGRQARTRPGCHPRPRRSHRRQAAPAPTRSVYFVQAGAYGARRGRTAARQAGDAWATRPRSPNENSPAVWCTACAWARSRRAAKPRACRASCRKLGIEAQLVRVERP
jgi:cell division protein FtsN